jgi:hypothetical protein|tara:strand:+ start:1041 stop:1292 length:252 start_codon:yes stop_codon:yes gene_type:complete
MLKDIEDNEIVTGTRGLYENEFVFSEHTNMGLSDELQRMFRYIEEHSNLKISSLNEMTFEQLRRGGNNGRAFNWKVETRDGQE